MSPPVCFLSWFYVFIYHLCHPLLDFSPGFLIHLFYLFILYVTTCLLSLLVLFFYLLIMSPLFHFSTGFIFNFSFDSILKL